MIRVLQVLTIMNRGGAETMIMNYYRAIDRSKVQFDFLLHRQEKGAYDDEIEALGGKIYRLFPISPKNYKAYKTAVHDFLLKHKEYHIIHSHLNALSFIILKEAARLGVPVRIAHSHTSMFNLDMVTLISGKYRLSYLLKFLLQNLLKRKNNVYANHYFSCGNKAAIWLFGKNRMDKVVIINNAIDTDNFTFNPHKSNDIKRRLNFNSSLIVGHVGNFVPEKNHSFILKVFFELNKININSRLVLVGGGKMDELKSMAIKLGVENNVDFLGVREDVNNILQGMDIFIFPSTNEGLPVTLIEAQASGLKILASDSITEELNITGNIHFFSLNESPQLWAEQIIKLCQYHRTNTKELIIDGNYDIEYNAQKLQNFYLNH